MNRILLTLGLPACLALTALAQPYKFGCHYFRQHPPAPAATSAADRALIDDIIARSDTFDILHYDIAIDVTDYSGQRIRAATTITYTPLMPDQAFIRFELWDLQVDSVIGADGPLVFSNDGSTLRVELPSPQEVGTEYQLRVHYQGTPHRDPDWGGFYFESNYIYNLGIGLTTVPPNFGKVWYPCFDSFVERATYTYHVKSAGTFRAHCQGTFLGEQQLAGDTVVRSYTLDQRIPTHLSAIAAADYQDHTYTHTGANGDIPVTLTAKPAQLAAMQGKFGDLGAAIDACEHWYGPYAWGRVGYVLTTDGALEIPTNIAYPDFMTGQSVFENRGLFTHELGHHWWGDMVTPHTHNDMWLKEGPAEYSAHLIEEWLGGEAAFIDVVKDNQLHVLRQAHVQDGGFQPLSPMPDAYIYGLHTYYKGAAVMHNLRGYLGDELFRQAMRGVQAHHAYETITAEQFKQALEDETGYDLDPFFDAWVFAPGFSTFVVQSAPAQPSGDGWDVALTIRQKLRGTTVFHQTVPLDVTFVGAGWQRFDTQVVAGDEFTEATVNVPFEPRMVVLNGHNRLNQARMDHEFTIRAGQSFTNILPYVDFRLYADAVTDSVRMRVEHIWSGPDQDALGWGIDQISSTHYWIVDGLWSEGSAFHGKVYYEGHAPTDLDNDLYGVTEAGALLVYRPTPQDPWEVYPDQTLSANILTNGTGNIAIDVLRKGQYAFAKGDWNAGIADAATAGKALQLYPVPASDLLTVRGLNGPAATAVFDVFTTDGKLAARSVKGIAADGEKRLDVSALAAGSYVLQVRGLDGKALGTGKFEVRR
ncbi:MAG: hypothetical protein JST66_12690 [Bacteroidetes bacterium]|nr:hypothetical protein [Bacteroidota bacterium]